MKYAIIFNFILEYELQIMKLIVAIEKCFNKVYKEEKQEKYFKTASLSCIIFLKILFPPKKVRIFFIKNQYGKVMGHIFHNTEDLT